MRGRKPKPAEQRKHEGNRGHRAISEPLAVARGRPPCPQWLTAEAHAEWKRIIAAFARIPDALSVVDRAALAIYCEAWATWHHAEQKLREEGHVIETEKGPKRNPWAMIANEAKATLLRVASEFGLTAVARTRLGRPGDAKPAGDDFDQFTKAR